MEEKIRKTIGEALDKLGAQGVPFVVERSTESAHGDYATNAAFAAAKNLGKKPHEVAEQLVQELSSSISLGPTSIQKSEVAGPGFVNITLARKAVEFATAEAAAQGAEWGRGNLKKGQRVMVEYTDPNPFKEMHIGHLMSNTIGESISRLIENEGAVVSRANYQGDVGVHVAKAIWGKQQKPEASWGEAYVWGSEHYDAHKEEIDALNKIIYEKSDPEINALYDEGRAQSLENFENVYRIFGTKFDFYFFESEVGPIGLDIVKKHPEIFEKSDGAVVFKGEPYGLHTRVFINSKGLPTYEAKELGLAEAKKQKGDFDLSLTVTANEISEYFKVVRKAAEMIFPDLEGKMVARFHGFLRLTTGKMSSREGNVITASDFIKEVIEKASEKNTDPLIAEQVAIGAIKYMILRQSPGSDIIFDEEKSLSLEGDSGSYLQYALVRAKSVIAKIDQASVPAGMIYHTSPNEIYFLERIILHFPEVAARAAHELAPNLLVNYLTELASEWNSFYAQERIIGGDHEAHKLLVARAFVQTMTNGLTLLGIPTSEKM